MTYTLHITNTGNVADTFDLSAGGNSWTTTFSNNSVALNTGATTAVSVYVAIPPGANDNDQDVAAVTAVSQSDGSADDSATLTTTAQLAATYGGTLSPNQSQSSVAGGKVTYVVYLSNEGNVQDTFKLEVSDNSWETSLSSLQMVVDAGDTTAVSVSVTIPADAEPGDFDIVTIHATSQRDVNQTATTTLTTSVKAYIYLPILLR